MKIQATSAFAAACSLCAVVHAGIDIVDSVEITADTNIVVVAGDTLKIEYVYGDNPVTVTKSGGGRLEVATSSLTNLSVVVAEGTFASVRPQALVINDDFRPGLRIDANDTSKFTISATDGTNFISKITDADGGTDRWLTVWGGNLYRKPYVAEEKLNGMGLIDFGTYRWTNDVERFAKGYGGNFALSTSLTLKEYFYVWKDRDDMFDEPMIGGKKFRGPSVLGNNGNAFLRGEGGGGTGFEIMSNGMWDTFKKNHVVDGQKVDRSFCPSRGFHVLRNRAYDTRNIGLSMIGWNHPQGGGFLLAELIACSNELTEATAKRVEAQLQSKWLGLKVSTLKVNVGATLDVGAFPFKIGTLDVQDGTTITGMTNLCCNAIARASSNVVATAAVTLDGAYQPIMPDLAFTGDAEISVSGTSRIQTVSSTTDRLVKSGDGELRLADPVMSNITVSTGTLSVSPLYARSAEYHLDATRADTIDWTETDGKKLVSVWHDMEDYSRKAAHSIYRKPQYDKSHCVNKPYLAENAVGSMTMIDFGTFANIDHQDGWGACLELTPEPRGVHDVFVAWIDDPAVKNYPYGASGTEFPGPCFLGMQYHWTRGLGGAGNSFAVHSTGCPINMWYPVDEKRVIVDGVVVHGQNDRLGDGMHVLSQRTTTNDNKDGAPVEQVGGHYQKDTYGGLKIGEVLIFKEYLTDRMRMRVSGALCSKWRGDTNEWAYGAISVAAGATLNHPYADLVPESLDVRGRLSAVSVRPASLNLVENGAEIDGTLILADGGSVAVAGNSDDGFVAITASAVQVRGRGTLSMTLVSPSSLAGQEFRIVESSNVMVEPGAQWKVPGLAGSGLRAILKAKPDGLYAAVEGCGMKMIIR